jgi:dipeptidyl aminopeptidase/acylaminoacyl peptidase
LPRNYSSGVRVPLVMQGHHYAPQVFLPDGPYSTTAAAQPLLARGMAVLQVEGMDLDVNTDREGAEFVEIIDSAVEALVAQGIADPTRIGLTGFSRGGYQAFYAITHPGRVHLSAVVIADTATGSYPRYLINTGHGLPTESFNMVGDQTFWNHKAQWLKNETTFNVDRVTTPALFTANGGSPYPEQSLETIGAFALNKKPMEYLYFPDGYHQLRRPRERLAAIDAIVDWMSFWLQDYENPDPGKAEQYARWRPMREMQKATTDSVRIQ